MSQTKAELLDGKSATVNLKNPATADNSTMNLVLQTGETDIAADDVIGKISFQAPDEGTGTDAILVAAGIQAVSEGDFSSSSNATSLAFMTGSSEAAAEKVRIDSSGALLVGTSIKSDEFFNANGSYVPGFQTFGTSNTAGRVSSFNYGAADAGGPIVILSKNRNTTSGSHTAVQDGDQLGILSFQGSDGTTYIEGASIRAAAISGIGGDDVPAELQFFTNTGTTGGTKHLTLNTDGSLVFNAAGQGIFLGVTTETAANHLSDYEEGTWSMGITDGTNNATLQSSYNTGRYRKIGSMVHIQGYLDVSSIGSCSGNIALTGLPFTVPNNSSSYGTISSGMGAGMSITAGTSVTGYPQINSTHIELRLWDVSTGASALQASELSNGEFIFSGSYMV